MNISQSNILMEPGFSNPDLLSDNPWGIQKNNNILIESSLASVNLPPSYEKLFRSLQPSRGKVNLSQVKVMLEGSGLSISTVDQILSLTTSLTDTQISKITFYLILALVALCQKNMSPSIEIVQQHINDLPTPVFTVLETSLASSKFLNSFPSPQSSMHTVNSLNRAQSKLYDPWQHPLEGGGGGGASSMQSELPDHASSLINSTLAIKSLKSRNQSIVEQYSDTIIISQDTILEGLIFKHINYIVQSEKLGTKVLRRYSQFYSLYKFLSERYTYRLVLDIPPKRIGVSEDFLQKRARGLCRFLNFIVNHPILGNDDIVKLFLTEPKDFQIPYPQRITEEDEITQRLASSNLEEDINSSLITMDVPNNLDVQLEKLHDALIKLVPYYSQIIQICDRMNKRIEANGQDLHQIGQITIKLGLNDSESSEEVTDWYLFSSKFPTMFTYLVKLGALNQNYSTALNSEFLERLKLIRDLSSSFLSLLDRAKSQPHTDISKINRRINLNQKTVSLMQRENPESTEISNLLMILEQDKKLVAEYKVRSQFIHRALWTELGLFRDVHLATTSRLLQELTQLSLKLANQQVVEIENLLN